uniref:Uncharacterized protein n=1 Tax=Tetraselmis sp. GSL018 TaxID=582737 RepID=A0A061QSL9_9CHLO
MFFRLPMHPAAHTCRKCGFRNGAFLAHSGAPASHPVIPVDAPLPLWQGPGPEPEVLLG